MALHNPPYYRYPLYNPWDAETFTYIQELAKNKAYPSILGSQEDKNQFLTTLIRTQKSLHDWREFPKAVLEQIKQNNTIAAQQLISDYPPETISLDTPLWVTYEEDKVVNEFINQLATRKISFIGTDQEIGEFVLRFIIGQLGNDWEQTIMMIWEMLGEEDTLSLKALNEELKSFDYMKLFE